MAIRRTWTDQQLIDALQKADSMADVLKSIGLRVAGGNHALVRSHILRLGLQTNFTHKRQKGASAARARSDEELFREGVTVTGSKLIPRLLKIGVIYQCVECGNEGTHNNKSLKLQIDHRNGKHDDNRLENLRLLCPNCHSQTDNFAGRATRGISRRKI